MSTPQGNELGYNYINPDYSLATEKTSLKGQCTTTTLPPKKD
jgi:hypothetical protein